MLPKKLQAKLDTRKENQSLRQLPTANNLIDFSSNDYLGLAKNEAVYFRAGEILKEHHLLQNGATGSRLLSGNHALYEMAEQLIAKTHKSEAALLFNSGYDANLGFFSCVPQRGDLILYDEFIHASIRDGIQMSRAKAYKFKHNDLKDLELKCQAERSRSPVDSVIYIVTESVFSMDGDSPDLKAFATLAKTYNAYLIVDEAHAVGVLGKNGLGLVQELGFQEEVFARLVTFGKALGCHGAAVLGSAELKSFLVNFARSFIYTTALPPHAIATVIAVYEKKIIPSATKEQLGELQKLRQNIQTFNLQLSTCNPASPAGKLQPFFLPSDSAIHSAIISGNERTRSLSRKLKNAGFDVKPILSPTVAAGKERLRFCLHSFNTEKQICDVLNLLKELLGNRA